MVSKGEVVSELESVDKSIRINPHSYRRANQRNVDLDKVKNKVEELDFHSVRENNQSDPRFSKTYKVVIKISEDTFYEMPIYFNMDGNEIYVKSVWNKQVCSKMAIKNFEYHRKDDIAVFEAGSYDNYERSVDVANFIVDLSEDGGFLGLEVIGASETLPLTKEQLSEVEEVEITVQEDENMMVSIIMKQEGEQTSLNLPVTDLNSQPA